MNHVTVEMPHDRAWTWRCGLCLRTDVWTFLSKSEYFTMDMICETETAILTFVLPQVCLSPNLCENKVEDKSYIS